MGMVSCETNFCDFLFVSLERNTLYLVNRIYFLRKKFAPRGANSFLNKLTPFQRGGRKENGRVTFLRSTGTGTLKLLLFYVHGKHLRLRRDGQLT